MASRWNIFNLFGWFTGTVDAETKEEAELYARELGFGDAVSLEIDYKYRKEPKTKKERDVLGEDCND
jgi:hypothetical protein